MNPGKCKAMLISRKRKTVQLPQFLLNGTPIQHVKNFKYLGVLLSSDLSWCNHINSICSKARKLLGPLYRRFYGSMNSDNLLNLYSLHVRPHLEYAAPSFAPPLLSSIFQGGLTGKKNFFAQITTNAFSYIRTESGASRSMRVGVMLFNSYEVLFLEWPLRVLIYLLRKGAYIDFLYIILKHTQ